MIAHSDIGKKSQEKAVRYDLSVGYDITFTVLYREEAVFKRDMAHGKVLRMDKSEIEISTSFPLKANHVLYWADRHKKDNFHLAMVKWAKQLEDTYRVGLSMLS
jgi:hypothetical protein